MQSIKTQLIASTSVLILAIALFVVVYFPQQQHQQHMQAFEQELQVLSESLALSIAVGLDHDNYESLSAAFDFAKRDSTLLCIAVLDVEGELIAAYPEDKATKGQNRVNVGWARSDTALAYTTPIAIATAHGFVTVSKSLINLHQAVSASRQTTVWIGLAIIALGTVIVYGIARMISTPINRLAAATRAIAAGEYTVRVANNRRDETGQLARHFNQMAQTIERSIGEIQYQRETAEKQVEERTMELSEANIQLQAQLQAQVRTEAALRESESKFRLLAETIQDVFWMSTPGIQQILYISPAYEKVWGRSCDSLYQAPQSLLESVHPEDRERVAAGLARHAQGEWSIDYRICRPDGAVRWIRDRGYPVRGEAGALECMVCIAADITELKQAETQLAEAHKMESIGQLAAGVAHEINSPMQFVGDSTTFLKMAFGDMTEVLDKYGQLLDQCKADGQMAEVVEAIEETLEDADVDYIRTMIPEALDNSLDGIDRVRQIVLAMKDFAHPGTGNKEAVDLNQTIEKATTVSRNEWKYVAELKLALDPDLPGVPCLAGDISRVIVNLVTNAAHAIAEVVGDGAQPKGQICISTHRDGDWVEVQVVDSGSGIPEAAQPHVFVPFFTTKDVGKGTGQGLAIAHDTVVAKHGGELYFETAAGQGTTFTMRLPLEPVAAEANPVEAA